MERGPPGEGGNGTYCSLASAFCLSRRSNSSFMAGGIGGGGVTIFAMAVAEGEPPSAAGLSSLAGAMMLARRLVSGVWFGDMPSDRIRSRETLGFGIRVD